MRLAVAFDNPLDGGRPYSFPGFLLWHREGENFETLTLERNISATGHWRGSISDGEVV